jgi:hypothetical protein
MPRPRPRPLQQIFYAKFKEHASEKAIHIREPTQNSVGLHDLEKQLEKQQWAYPFFDVKKSIG